MHRQHVLFRQQEVLHREHGLLHLTGVTHARQQDAATREVDQHDAVGVGAITLWLAGEVRRVEDGPLALVLGIEAVRTHEHGTREQVVPGRLGGHADRQVVLEVSADMQLGDEAVALAEVVLDALPQGVETLRAERAIDAAPVDGVRGGRLVDDEAVVRGASATGARLHDQRAVVGQTSFAASHCQLDQLCAAEIGVSGHRTVLMLAHSRLRGSGPPSLLMAEARCPRYMPQAYFVIDRCCPIAHDGMP